MSDPLKLNIVYQPISALTPYVNNARIHTTASLRKLERSIRKFGFLNPVLVDAAGNVICGHGRLLAAQQRAWTSCRSLRWKR